MSHTQKFGVYEKFWIFNMNFKNLFELWTFKILCSLLVQHVYFLQQFTILLYIEYPMSVNGKCSVTQNVPLAKIQQL